MHTRPASSRMSGNMATQAKSRSRKRKLPKDLAEASKMATSCIAATRRVSDACSSLKETSLNDFQGANVSSEEATLYLIARYGVKEMAKICKVVSGLPDTLTAFQKAHYLRQLTGREDADLIGAFVEDNCPDMCDVFDHSPAVLAPPTSICLECERPLTSYHQCDVCMCEPVYVVHAIDFVYFLAVATTLLKAKTLPNSYRTHAISCTGISVFTHWCKKFAQSYTEMSPMQSFFQLFHVGEEKKYWI